MGEEVHLKGVRRASLLPLWRPASGLSRSSVVTCSLTFYHHVEWLEWIYKETLTELTNGAGRRR